MKMPIGGVVFICSAACLFSQTETKEGAVLELGGASSWNIRGGAPAYGADVAVEVTPIAKWLAIEMGTTSFISRRGTEWDTDILFRKPWDLTRKLELMVGGGPAWVRSKEDGVVTNSVALEASIHFMYWPSERRRFGWFIEPGYEYNLAKGHERSLGISAGLLIAIPKLRGGKANSASRK